MASTSMALSAILKQKDNTEEPKKKTREEWKKAKELEEARKAGTVPAVVDESGKDINPHIPQYISSAPWYVGASGPTLKHQRPQPEKQQTFDRLDEYYKRGLTGDKAKKWRKGACENCGAMGHTKKDCCERPRKVIAKYSNKVIAHDDVALPNLKLDYDGKRDRWNGYDPSEYNAVIEEHEKVEDFKRQLKAQQLQDGEDIGEEDSDSEDEDKYAENIDMPGTKVDSKQRITVRNLRIRDDTAKYLRNLDPNSAYYDPKTRSMRGNPYANTNKNPEDVDYAGENFVRISGDTINQAKAQMFAWEAYEKGVDVSLLAEPTKLEILQREFQKKKEEYKKTISDDLLQKYGGKEYLDAPPKELLLAQTENYVEYSRTGKIIKGAEQQVVKSRYEEDVHPNNHVSVWGSYWRSFRWGYACCHSFVKNSYCTGDAGKEAAKNLELVQPDVQEFLSETVSEPKSLLEMHKNYRAKRQFEDDPQTNNEDRVKRLREALIKAAQEDSQDYDEKSRNYNSMYENIKLTEEQIEAYNIRKIRPDDPMANYKDSE